GRPVARRELFHVGPESSCLQVHVYVQQVLAVKPARPEYVLPRLNLSRTRRNDPGRPLGSGSQDPAVVIPGCRPNLRDVADRTHCSSFRWDRFDFSISAEPDEFPIWGPEDHLFALGSLERHWARG